MYGRSRDRESTSADEALAQRSSGTEPPEVELRRTSSPTSSTSRRPRVRSTSIVDRAPARGDRRGGGGCGGRDDRRRPDRRRGAPPPQPSSRRSAGHAVGRRRAVALARCRRSWSGGRDSVSSSASSLSPLALIGLAGEIDPQPGRRARRTGGGCSPSGVVALVGVVAVSVRVRPDRDAPSHGATRADDRAGLQLHTAVAGVARRSGTHCSDAPSGRPGQSRCALAGDGRRDRGRRRARGEQLDHAAAGRSVLSRAGRRAADRQRRGDRGARTRAIGSLEGRRPGRAPRTIDVSFDVVDRGHRVGARLRRSTRAASSRRWSSGRVALQADEVDARATHDLERLRRRRRRRRRDHQRRSGSTGGLGRGRRGRRCSRRATSNSTTASRCRPSAATARPRRRSWRRRCAPGRVRLGDRRGRGGGGRRARRLTGSGVAGRDSAAVPGVVTNLGEVGSLPRWFAVFVGVLACVSIAHAHRRVVATPPA